MSVLVLTPQIPFPPQQGASLRNFHIIQGLAAAMPVSLLSFAEPDQSPDVTPLVNLLEKFETVPVPGRSNLKRLTQLISSPIPDMGHRLYEPQFFKKLERMLAELRPEVVQIEGIELVRAISTVQQVLPSAKIVFDNHNAETALQERIYQTDIQKLSKLPKALYSRVQVSKLRRFEQWACQQADVVTAVSERDAHLLQKFRSAHQSEVVAIPNCIDLENYRVSQSRAKDIDLVFTGKMDYRPNVDGMLWFMQEIWPLIQQQKPNATLAIVGKNPSESILALGNLKGITVTGAVPEIQPWLDRAQVMVMPLRMGSGTRLKLIQALAAGLPIVSTTNGAEGYPISAGKDLLIGDTPDQFATEVCSLLDSPNLREKLGNNGRGFAQSYDWRRVIPRFIELYNL
ncbi:MAG: glycosyltransferase [Chloroflexota bacterium]